MSKSGLFAHFRSKEQLQLQTMERARERFVDIVVRPALAGPRGEKRVRAVFDGWLTWSRQALDGGCIFVAAAVELDDRPGPLRDALVANERDWLELLATVAGIAVAEGEFRPDLDLQQFAFEVHAVMLGHHHASRLLRDRDAEVRTLRAFESLVEAARHDLGHLIGAHPLLRHPPQRGRLGPVAAQADLQEPVAAHRTRLDEPAHGRAVTVEQTEVAFPGVGVRIEVNHAHPAQPDVPGDSAGVGQGDRVVAAQHHGDRARGGDGVHGRLQRGDRPLEVARRHLHVAGVEHPKVA